jgi:hypothetical protein
MVFCRLKDFFYIVLRKGYSMMMHTISSDLILYSIPDSLHSTTQFGCPRVSHHDFVGASFGLF